MFCDEVHIEVTSGRGGNGAMSFRREKYIPKGGPDGGDGGKGGDVIFKVNTNLNTLYNLKGKKVFKAPVGGHGMGNNMHGKNAEDLIIEVPQGTLVFDEEQNVLLADLEEEAQEYIVCRGGRGGYGNAHFVSSVRKTPRFAEIGDINETKMIKLELKLIADVGIIGFPSVGKSTLISVISNAKPKIADYHFTTLVPNLGVAHHKGENIVVSDIPGLIEGASEGKGLGFQFLKHIERCRMLVHVIDATELDHATEKYDAIRKELENYSSTLSSLPEVIALNKTDLIDEEILGMVKDSLEKHTGEKIFPISSATRQGLSSLLDHLIAKLAQIPKQHVKEAENEEQIVVIKPLEEDPNKWWIEENHKHKLVVRGARIEQIARMTDTANMEALERIFDVLHKWHISNALEKKDLHEGDPFYIGDIELKYMEKL